MSKKIQSISAIWYSDKKESVEVCTFKVLCFLEILKNYDNSLFATWYEKGNSKKEALMKKVEFTSVYIKNALEKKWDKKFDDLGSRVSFWSGNIDENSSSEISFKVGAYGSKSFNTNSCVITLPTYANSIYEKQFIELIEVFKNYWIPDIILVNGEEV
jgi:hypothetical protein